MKRPITTGFSSSSNANSREHYDRNQRYRTNYRLIHSLVRTEELRKKKERIMREQDVSVVDKHTFETLEDRLKNE